MRLPVDQGSASSGSVASVLGAVFAIGAALAVAGCGSTGSGASNGTGGEAAESGGSSGTGGGPASGGSGMPAGIGDRGGVSASGGTTGGGTSSGGSIGATGTGGTASPGTATGGSGATGGRGGNGGAAARGSGGAPSGGSAGSAGPSGGGGAAVMSAGCGSANVTSACSKSGTTCSLDVDGMTRTYYLQLPSDYAPSKPYPVIFQFHPLGGSAEQALTLYRLNTGIPEAIYVTPQGLVSNGNAGWPNTNDQDIDFVKAMVSMVQTTYCVDNARIFSVGFSYGGMMSYAIGCELADTFRAIAPMSGALYSGCKGDMKPIAMWGSHGTSDTVVPIDDGRKARDQILKQNHCGTDTVPVDPSPCVAYQGCDPGYPVTWCEWDGPHGIPSFGSSAIISFLKQF